MKKMGRSHQPFFRICAVDKHAPRDGKVIEELGTYDPRVPETDARAIFNAERIDYWLSVGAQPSEKVAVLIKKYGTQGHARCRAEGGAGKAWRSPRRCPIQAHRPACPSRRRPRARRHRLPAQKRQKAKRKTEPAAQGDEAVPEGA